MSTLPVTVRGNSATNSMRVGHLTWASRSRVYAMSSSAVASAPSWSFTVATGVSPRSTPRRPPSSGGRGVRPHRGREPVPSAGRDPASRILRAGLPEGGSARPVLLDVHLRSRRTIQGSDADPRQPPWNVVNVLLPAFDPVQTPDAMLRMPGRDFRGLRLEIASPSSGAPWWTPTPTCGRTRSRGWTRRGSSTSLLGCEPGDRPGAASLARRRPSGHGGHRGAPRVSGAQCPVSAAPSATESRDSAPPVPCSPAGPGAPGSPRWPLGA